MLSVEKGLPRAIHGLVSRLKQVYTVQEIQARCWPSFEKEFLLSRLRARGYRLAVCSNAVRESVVMMLEKAGILRYFELVVSNEDVSRPKPDPEIYLETCRRLGVDPARVVVVEDAPHGIESAHKAGTRVCEVTGFPEVEWARVGKFVDQAETSLERSPAC